MDTIPSDTELKTALENAKYAALTSRARTEQANALVDYVMGLLPNEPQGRRGAYADTRTQRRCGVEGFLGDLLRAQNSEKAQGWVYRSLRPGSFTGEEVGYRAFTQVKDGLIETGLVEIMLGWQKWTNAFGTALPTEHRKATRFRATEELLRASAVHGVAAPDAGAHFPLGLPAHPLQLRASSTRSGRDKERGRPMRFDPSPQTEELEAQLRELNEFFDQFQLRGGMHRGFNRIFNQGDLPDFNWNKGGRLYSHGPDNYQSLSSEHRLLMTINGEPVCEIDIRASYLTIFHAWFDEQLDLSSDPYVLPGLGPEARNIAKLWFVATFGNDGHLTRWPEKIVRDYREQTGRRLGRDYPIRRIYDAAIKAFPLLAHWGDRDGGWADLMYAESVAMIWTMLDLMREHSVPTLTVHDSLIVPASKRALAEEQLAARYRWVTQVTPKLVAHSN